MTWIDSVKNARLVYITGGDQNKFMDIVRGSKLYEALQQSYHAGATISGTSAGAAIMSQIMITGAQKGNEKAEGFREIRNDIVETNSGMGFLKNVIIDQHFVMRSRYNRLLSVLADYPSHMAIGVDEGTALVVHGKQARVSGDSQVVVIRKPQKNNRSKNGKVTFENAKFSLYTHGQKFKLN